MGPDRTDDRSSRTWLCSVVFLDIVGYSRHSVENQLKIKEHFNQRVCAAISGIVEKERIILDTGDGAALCFLGDPENALFAAINIRNSICEANSASGLPYQVRIGVNLGPVKLIKDVNGRENAVGDGINTAQRIMGFAGDSQILVSRSYYEVISCLGEDFAHLFHYQGVHADKHVRKHTVYEVLAGDEGDTGSSVTRETTGAASAAQPFDAETLGKVEASLAARIGPMAQVLVQRHAGSSASLEDLCRKLAEAIPGAADRSIFLARHAVDGDGLGVGAAVQEAPVPDVVAEFPPETLARMEQALAETLGPMARVLVRRAAAGAADERELADRLAAEIGNARDRDTFLGKVLS